MSGEKSLEQLCAEHFNESFRFNLQPLQVDICQKLLKSGHLKMEGPLYRIPSPKPKYRPWTAEEAIGKAVYHKNAGRLRLILAAGRATVDVQGEGQETYETLLEWYMTKDGTPCGVEIREEAE